MDILLVSSINVLWPEPDMAPYLGLLVLRDILKDDYEVEYVDFRLIDELVKSLPTRDPDEAMRNLARYLLSKKPKIVGFYTICNTFVFSSQVAACVKEMDAEVKIVFGGPHATVTAQGCLEAFPFLDAVCLGEAERSIKPLMDALMNDGDLAQVPGVAYHTNSGVAITQPAELISDEELGHYTVFDYAPTSPETINVIYLEGGRGCPYSCTFCSTSTYWGRRFRLKPVEVLIEEMDKLYEMYKISTFGILHDHFTSDKQRIREFCRLLIDSGRNYQWSCSARADSLDAELLDLMKESQCYAIYLGIETGSNRMQRIIRKNLRAEDALEAFKLAHERGIATKVSFIYGFVEETEEDFLETLKMIEAIFMMGTRLIQLHPYNITPATEETRKAKERLYFDRNAMLDYSLYNKKLFSDEYMRLIEQNPDLYEQYYTFDTLVRKKYQNIDTLIHLIVHLSLYCRKSIEHLIGLYGLAGLFLKHKARFKDLRERIDEIAAFERDNISDLALVYGVYEQMLQNEIEEINDLGFSQICKYERHLVEFVVDKTRKPVVHGFVLDMEELLTTGRCIEASCNLIYFVREGQIITMKGSSIFSIFGFI